jgi:large repetitive protein
VTRIAAAAVVAMASLAAALVVLGIAAPTSPAGATNQYTTTVGANSCGNWTSIPVPSGVASAAITLVGGGGGGGYSGSDAVGGTGAGGATVTSTIPGSTIEGSELWVYTGCGGGGGQNSSPVAQGGTGLSVDTNGSGGDGGYGGSDTYQGGGGGGSSKLCVNSGASDCSDGAGTAVAVAGGGGGGGGAYSYPNGTNGGSGGAGGQNGAAGGVIAACAGCTGGGGGTSFSNGMGGQNSTSSSYDGASGDLGTGGDGGSHNGDSQDVGGGGGGGGSWGGGGGAADYQTTAIGASSGTGGGGGSSNFDSSYGTASYSTVSGTASNCGSTASQCSSTATGQGGTATSTGAAGYFSVTWSVGGWGPNSSFSSQPGTGTIGAPLDPQPEVYAADYQNAPVPGDHIELQIDSQPSGATAYLTCGLNPVQTNSSGMAAFSNCAITGPGGAYTLSAYDVETGLVIATTSSFQLDASPQITSTDSTTFTVGTTGSFMVTTSGAPTPMIDESGTLPVGVTFTDNHDGTATLGGTPAIGAGGVYDLVLTASNGQYPDATQDFTLTVDEAPTISSAAKTQFLVGRRSAFQFTAHAYPSASWSESGNLPRGVTLDTDGRLSGVPGAGTVGDYPITVTADNGVAPAGVQKFTLTVRKASTTMLTPEFNPVNVGHPVTYLARVTPSSATGTVTITGCGTIPLASGEARCTRTYATVGHRAITAAYSGSARFAATSDTVDEAVKSPAKITVSLSTSHPTVGQAVQATATVSSRNPSVPMVPSGDVGFFLNNANVSFCQFLPLPGKQPNTVTCTIRFSSAGKYLLRGHYKGDGTYNPANTFVRFEVSS